MDSQFSSIAANADPPGQPCHCLAAATADGRLNIATTNGASEAILMAVLDISPDRLLKPGYIRPTVAFVVTFSVLVYCALRGGSYDLVVRQEEALVIWWVLGLGFALGRLTGLRRPRGAALPLLAMLVLVAWTASSLLWTASAERTTAELARAVGYLGVVLLVGTVIDRTTWFAAGAGALAAGVLVCFLALLHRLAPGAFAPDAVASTFHNGRLDYPFNYWNAVAAWALMTGVVALSWSADASRPWVRALCLGSVPICAVAVYLTYSRGGLVAACFSLIALLVLSERRWSVIANAVVAGSVSAVVIEVVRREREIATGTGSRGGAAVATALVVAALACAAFAACKPRLLDDRLGPAATRRLKWLAVGLALIGALAVVPPIASRVVHAIRNPNAPPPRIDSAIIQTNYQGARNPQLKAALTAFENHPLQGTGAGTVEFTLNSAGNVGLDRNVGSLYVQELAELGLPGLIAVVAFLLGLGIQAFRARRSVPGEHRGLQLGLATAFVAYLVHGGIDWLWQVPAITVLAIVCAALAAAPLSSPRTGRRTRWIVVAFAVFACLVQVPGLVATTRLRASQSDLRAGASGAALKAATDAITTEPWAASPYAQRGLVEEAVGDLALAAADLRRAASREPTNFRYPLVLARVDTEAGNPGSALAMYRQARTLRPASVFFEP